MDLKICPKQQWRWNAYEYHRTAAVNTHLVTMSSKCFFPFFAPLLFFFLFLPDGSECVTCFICSLMGGKSCPGLSTDPTVWAKNSVKYYTITGSKPEEKIMCAVAYGKTSGKVFYQVR